nr:MAG TPA: hypothetical protein [Caudoviricetes sp.]
MEGSMAMITADQLKAGIGSYLQMKMMPRLDSKRQFLLGTVYGLGAARMDALLSQAAKMPALRALGVMQENGEIDLSALYDAAQGQMQAQGKLTVEIPFMGTFSFDEGDLRDLYQAINGQEERRTV